MYKVILLIDVENCKFIIEKVENNWVLPTVSDVENVEEIPGKIKKKYDFDITNVILVDKKDKVLLIKCNLQTKTFNKKIYKSQVLNEIATTIKEKQQKEFITDVLVKIGFEMINDSFWLGIILTIEDNLEDTTMKFLLSDFLIFFSAIFCEESLIYKFGGIKEDFNTTEGEIKKIRNSYLKDCPLFESKKSKKIIDEMGIDFNSLVYDNVLFFVNNELIDINSRTWKNREKEIHHLLSGIVLSPRRWIKNCYPQFNSVFERIRNVYIDSFIDKFNKLNVSYKSYSSYKLFYKSKISNNEKTYILQRIGLLKTILLISKTFGQGNFITLQEGIDLSISFDNFLLKVKATIIEMIWSDYKQNENKLFILKNIFNNYPKDISDDFFRINRKCRDNIHYGFYYEINEIEKNILNKFQDNYIEYIIMELEKEIKFKFNLTYKIGLSIAKLQYWASH